MDYNFNISPLKRILSAQMLLFIHLFIYSKMTHDSCHYFLVQLAH